MKPLFDVFKRTRTSIKGYEESSYNFINESGWHFVEYFRTVINSWYKDFPADTNFTRMFKSKNDWEHQSAFFEIFMFSLFKETGYHVDYHTSVGNRKPDLKLSSPKQSDIYIDCTLSGEPNTISSIQNIEDGINNVIESIESPFYYVNINIECGLAKYPKISALKSEISSRLRKLENGNKEPQNFRWENNGWVINIRFHKKPSPTDVTIGSYISSQGGGFVDAPSYDILAETLNSKRGSKYNTKSPFFIAVDSHNIVLNQDIVKSVLFGDTEITGFSSVKGKKAPFFYTNKPQNSSVTGVILVHGLNAMNMDKVQIDFWYNPWTLYPLDNLFQKFNQYIPDLDNTGKLSNIRYSPGNETYQLLGIENDYFR